MRNLVFGLILSGLSLSASAQDMAFSNLSEQQAKSIIEEFSGNFTHTSVSGASPLGSVFGFELGVIAGATSTKEIDKLAKQTNPNAEADKIPHAGILAMVSVPFGLTAEMSFVPEMGNDEFKFKNTGLAAKWSLTSGLIELPFSVAIKAHMMKTDLSFTQVGAVTATVDFKDTVTGAMLLVSKDLGIVEPYLGVGAVSGDGDFTVTGTSIFASGVKSYNGKSSGTQILGGIEANLLILKAGVEYSQQFGVSRYTAKIALSF